MAMYPVKLRRGTRRYLRAVASLPGAPGPGFILYEFELNLTVIR